MKLSIVDAHHEVLIPWSLRRMAEGGPAPDVWVLDHHTDVLAAFRDPARAPGRDDWRDPEKVRRAVSELRHDEHFDWALKSGLIRSCTTASHVDATPPSDSRMHIRKADGWMDENHVFADPERFRPLADSVLESDHLRKVFGDVPPPGFLLDIDCDCFHTWRSFHPKDPEFFQELKRKAVQITVSLEPEWVRLLRFPGETFTARDILRALFPY